MRSFHFPVPREWDCELLEFLVSNLLPIVQVPLELELQVPLLHQCKSRGPIGAKMPYGLGPLDTVSLEPKHRIKTVCRM